MFDVHVLHRNWIAALFVLMFILLFATLSTAIVANVTLVSFIHTDSLLPVLPTELVGASSRHEMAAVPENFTQREEIQRMLSPNTVAAVSALSGHSIDDPRTYSNDHVSSSLIRFWQAFSFSQRNELQTANQIIRSDPRLIQYLAVSGVRAYDDGDFATGIKLLKTAATLSEPSLLKPIVYESLSKAINRYEHNRQDALRWANKWIDSDSTNTDAYIWTVALYLWSGDPELAHQTLLAGHSSDVEQHRAYPGQMGQIYQARSEWSTAIRYYRRAWELARNSPQERELAAWYLGNALANNGQADEAQDYLQIALQSGAPAVQKQASQLLSKLRDNK